MSVRAAPRDNMLRAPPQGRGDYHAPQARCFLWSVGATSGAGRLMTMHRNRGGSALALAPPLGRTTNGLLRDKWPNPARPKNATDQSNSATIHLSKPARPTGILH